MSEIAPIDRALLPAAVRDGSPQQRDAYTAALGFERQLVAQLAEQLSKTTATSEDESAATSAARDQIPGLLADAVQQAGGLGLAAQIAAALVPAGTSSTSDPTTGASAA